MRAKRADGGVEPRLCYLPSTPQSPRGDSSPSGEPFGILQPPSQSCPRLRGIRAERAQWARSARIPRTRWRLLVRFTNLYINNNGDASRPLIFTISYAHPPQGGSHIVQAIFHCALAQFHPFARTDFTAGVSPLTSPFLPGQRSGSRRPPRCRW